MGVKFTEQQNRAIETLDKSVLVSAAAGSGKTAVLIERIINIILKGEADVDEMLVVTFTKAAAAEMRLKLARAIKKEMKEHPENRAKMREQLNKLYRAYISTFDSFAVRVIKEFFYEIDIEPDFKACDEVQSELMQREALDGLFEEAFVCDNLIAGGSFRSFLRLYSKERSENEFKNDILKSYAKLRSIHNYWDWAEQSAENLRVTRDGFGESKVAKAMLMDMERTLDIALKAIEEIKNLYVINGIEDKFYQMLGDEYELIGALRAKAAKREWTDAFADHLEGIEWTDLRSFAQYFTKEEAGIKETYKSFSKEITPLRKVYKDAVNSIVNRYFLPDFDTRLEEMNATYEHTIYYLNLMKAFEERYQARKQEAGVLDFADMEHLAVQILEKETPAKTFYNRFKYIFIDEYQDTNNIQETLISCFAHKDNVFKVGDVKQSIYRFRQAEPAIFERVYNEYSDEASEDAVAIDLNMNFRSNDGTIRYINEVFANIMEGYDSRAQLYTGLSKGPGYQDEYDFKPEVHVLTKASLDDEEAETETPDVASEEIENLSVEEAEAKYIAELVRDTIGTEFCDTKTGEIRKATARDIVILFRATKVRGEVMARALRNVEVQSHIEEADNYFDTIEIGVALSLFTCIDNMKRDVPLIATLHSEVFGWTPAELASVRIAHRQHVANTETGYRRPPYWEAVAWYAENGDDEILKEKVNYAYEKIRDWRDKSNMMTTPDFIWKVLVDSGYYLRVGAMFDGDRRQANLRVLVDRARQYCEGTVASLSSFLRFIEVMKTKNISNGQASMVSQEDDVVRISTIHKSKGLEYPFVIVGGLGHHFRMDNNEMKLSFDSELGVAMPYVSPDRRYWRSSIMQRAINAKGNAESYKEELRVLYVAMTRARNKLFLVGTVDSEEKLLEFSANPNNFLKVMREVLDTDFNDYYVKPLERTENAQSATRVQQLLASRSKVMSPETLRIYEEIDRRLSYEYPYKDELEAKSKYSVSEVRREELKAEREAEAIQGDNEVVNLWRITDNKKKASAADIGIAYHRIMEYLDFTKISSSYIDDAARDLLNKGAIEQDVFKKLDLAKIRAFFGSELGMRAIMAAKEGKLKKEKAFTLKTDWQGREILVQGVIDCCWEENGQMVLVDYKSGHVNPSEYKTQVDLYSQAIEEGTGVLVKEAYLYLFEKAEAIAMK